MRAALARPADGMLLVVGVAVTAAGIRGMPGTRRLPARPGFRHTWRHGALVFAASTYACTVPAVGAFIVMQALHGVAD